VLISTKLGIMGRKEGPVRLGGGGETQRDSRRGGLQGELLTSLGKGGSPTREKTRRVSSEKTSQRREKGTGSGTARPWIKEIN